MMSLLFDAAVLGLLVAVILRDGFPGWPSTLGVVVGIWVVHAAVERVLPEELWPVALVAAALVLFVLSRKVWGLTTREGIRLTVWYFLIMFTLGLVWLALLMA